jgi:hypothetical protein
VTAREQALEKPQPDEARGMSRNEVLSLMRAAFEAGASKSLALTEHRKNAPISTGTWDGGNDRDLTWLAALAEIEKTTASPPVEPQPAATGLETVAWLTQESWASLHAGGNSSRGTVPVHRKQSSTAHIALVSRTAAEAAIAAAESRGAAQQKQRDVEKLKAEAYANRGSLTGLDRVYTRAAELLEADGAGER